ncbi:hypothetical protein OE88DRAFT_1734668 [Heliocybe sulcata]|uniref:Uncharacterized protein n=1 Tax=Heliocybe sulcata TaxID=5364 RepID=A0A5C3N1V0_9AGAM|nr:hypothetical protein OE88DRAFT_1734668 [Heliocybe sulcata]
MAVTKAKPARKNSTARKTTSTPSASLAELQALGKEKTTQYLHARNTTAKYQQQVANARKWFASFSTQQEQSVSNNTAFQPGDGELGLAEKSVLLKDPMYCTALEGHPVEATPTVISMYLVHKCFEQDLGNSTAAQIHAALLHEYDQLDGGTYRGQWSYHETQQKWTGNPVRSAVVEDMMECMETLYEWSMTQLAPEKPWHLPENPKHAETKAIYLQFLARSSLSFVIWTRNCESTQLQYKHFEFNDEWRKGGTPLDPPYFEVNLKNRKNWQCKQDKNQALCGHNYKIYTQPKTPVIDMYAHILDWFDYYEVLLGRQLQPDDYVFPFIGPDCKVHPHRALTSDLVQKELNDFAERAGLCLHLSESDGRFLSSDGGEAGPRKSIYLLDELYNYEEDHSDAPCPISREADQSLMGEAALTRAASVADLHQLMARIDEKNQVLVRQVQVMHHIPPPAAIPYHAAFPAVPPVLPNYASVSISSMETPRREVLFSRPLNFHFPPIASISAPQFTPYQPPAAPCTPSRKNPAWIIPKIPTGSGSWTLVLRDWEYADSSRSLSVPLRDWTEEQIKQGGAVVYGQRKTIATEFIDIYRRDEAKFKADYPEHTAGITALLEAIRKAKGRRGELKLRRSKNGSPEERAQRYSGL